MSSCYFHPDAESVVTCAKCGVGLCRECESNAFIRTHNGTGQALCNNCSFTEAKAQVDYELSWMIKRAIKLIICAILVFIGLYYLLTDPSDGILFAGICWFISGIIANIGVPKVRTMEDAYVEYHAPISTMIFKILFTTVLGPLSLLFNLIGFLRTWFQYKKDLKLLEKIKATINA